MQIQAEQPQLDHDWKMPEWTSALPAHMRLLCVGADEPSWINLTLQLDAEGCIEPHFRWVSAATDALALLRDETFDCILLSGQADQSLNVLRAIRSSGSADPIVIVTDQVSDQQWAEVCHKDCELLVTTAQWESAALVAVIKRAVARTEVQLENRRFSVANQRRHVRERDEADHLLSQQHQILSALEALARSQDDPTTPTAISDEFSDENGQTQNRSRSQVPSTRDGSRLSAPRQRVPLPNKINDYYQELLRTYVIMGSGNLGKEIAKLAELLTVAGLSPREGLQLHLQRVESLVRGLGNRSTRHVMARADLLALELMIHMGECYQRKWLAVSQ
jgi:DNA-binding response OmpR family regulator